MISRGSNDGYQAYHSVYAKGGTLDVAPASRTGYPDGELEPLAWWVLLLSEYREKG